MCLKEVQIIKVFCFKVHLNIFKSVLVYNNTFLRKKNNFGSELSHEFF